MNGLELKDYGGTLIDEVLDTVDTPIVILAADGNIIRFNAASQRLTGYTAEEVIGRKVWDFLIFEQEISPVRAVFETTRSEGKPTHFINFWKTKSGERRLIEWSNKTIRNNKGDLFILVATGIDITDRTLTAHKLSETRTFLRSIVDASPVAIVTIDEKGLIQNFSREAERCFGYAEREVRERNISLLMPDPDQSRHDQYISRYLATGEKRIIGRARQVTALRKSGEKFPAMVHVSEFKHGQRVFVGFIQDLTEQKATERRLEDTQTQLHHAGRIGAMGEIATSIAHELNQPLTAAASLAGAVSLTLKKGDHPDVGEATALLDDVISEVRRASEIIRRIREFIRKQKSTKSLHDLNQIVEEASTIALLGAEADGIEVDMQFDEHVGEAHIDRIQIQQVVINLIRNAIDAMRDAKEKRLAISTTRKDAIIELKVSDTGPGVPEEIKARLFEPFVTSKVDGMGIGLSISKSIIDAHQGEITATSGESAGSEFTVRLPIGIDDEHHGGTGA